MYLMGIKKTSHTLGGFNTLKTEQRHNFDGVKGLEPMTFWISEALQNYSNSQTLLPTELHPKLLTLQDFVIVFEPNYQLDNIHFLLGISTQRLFTTELHLIYYQSVIKFVHHTGLEPVTFHDEEDALPTELMASVHKCVHKVYSTYLKLLVAVVGVQPTSYHPIGS